MLKIDGVIKPSVIMIEFQIKLISLRRKIQYKNGKVVSNPDTKKSHEFFKAIRERKMVNCLTDYIKTIK